MFSTDFDHFSNNFFTTTLNGEIQPIAFLSGHSVVDFVRSVLNFSYIMCDSFVY